MPQRTRKNTLEHIAEFAEEHNVNLLEAEETFLFYYEQGFTCSLRGSYGRARRWILYREAFEQYQRENKYDNTK